MNATGLPVTLRTGRVAAGQRERFEFDDQEAVLVILGGTCEVACDGGPRWTELGERTDVFAGRATACYLPPGQRWQIEAGAVGVSFAVASAAASTPGQPYVVRPAQVRTEIRGTGVWQREVHDIIDSQRPAAGLLVGETFSDRGVWSSYPPHKHDEHDPPRQSVHQESFLVRVDPPTGFGVFIHYPTPEDPRQASIVQDGDVVSVESGYHSFVAAAGHRFYYLWALAGTERTLHFRTDPRHEWLLDTPEAAG